MSWRQLGYGGAPAPGKTVRIPHIAKKPKAVNLDAIGGMNRIIHRQDVQTPYPAAKPYTASELMSLGKPTKKQRGY